MVHILGHHLGQGQASGESQKCDKCDKEVYITEKENGRVVRKLCSECYNKKNEEKV